MLDVTDVPAFNSVIAETIQVLRITLGGTLMTAAVDTIATQQPSVARIFYGGAGPTIAPLTMPRFCSIN